MKSNVNLLIGVVFLMTFLPRGLSADNVILKDYVTGEGNTVESGKIIEVNGKPWARTVTTPFDADRREETYKVFTHILDFEGKEPITKGAGGKYTHHRGMFIGWKATAVGDSNFDTWHMKKCTQQLKSWKNDGDGIDASIVDWIDDEGKTFIREKRRITPRSGDDGMRIFDFESTLESLAGKIELRGDLQHAGMQVRMANEVSEHQDSTNYILPEGRERSKKDEVTGGWWVCCSPVVRDKRYWLMHMTPPDHPTGVPVYSIRSYARFGAFFEPDLEEGKPLHLKFRVLVSEGELDQARCQSLYDEYASTRGLVIR